MQDFPSIGVGTLADITTSDFAYLMRAGSTLIWQSVGSGLSGDAVIQRILVATNFSQSADAAWRWAVYVGRKLDAELRLVHVAMPMSAETAANLHQDYDRGFALAQRLLEERAAAAPASRIKTIVRRGERAQVVAALARDEHIDIVIVGTHEHHPAGDILIGSSPNASFGLPRVRSSW